MSDELVENDFKNIFEAIKDISNFLLLAINESLDVGDIKQLFSTSYHIETLISGLKKRNLESVFENKLNNYLKSTGKILFVSNNRLEKCCDEVMNKMLTIRPSCEILSLAIDEYIKLTSYDRFEKLVERLAEFRSVFMKLSHATKGVLTSVEVQSSFLVRSWLKVIDSSENGDKEIEHIMHQMFDDVNAVETMIAILNMEQNRHNSLIQNLLVKLICSEVSNSSFSSTWKAFLQSENLVNAVLNCPELLDPILSTFELMENRCEFDKEKKLWTTRGSCDIDCNSLIKVLSELLKLDEFHYKIKRFIRIRKVKGASEFWYYFEKEQMS